MSECSDFVFFIYDSVIGINLKEEDDPALAISYFYPSSWSSYEQCWFCGYLMGLSRQMSRILGHPPELIKLRKRKFTLTQREKYVIVLGVPVAAFSDESMGKICEFILDVFMLLYPTLDSLIESAGKERIVDCVIKTIVSRPWTDLEFQNTAFTKPSEQKLMLKCGDILNYAARRNGVFGCCFFFQKCVIQSILNQRMTRLTQFCISSTISTKVTEIKDKICRFVPVFLASEDYSEIVKKQKQRLSNIHWEEYSYVQFKGVDAARSEQRFSDLNLTTENDNQAFGQFGNADEQYQTKDSDSKSETVNKVSEESAPSTTTSEDLERSQQSESPTSSDIFVPPTDTSACPGAKELALCILGEGDLTLAILMEKYTEDHSLILAESFLQGCIRDLKYINEELSDASDWTKVDEGKPGKQTINHSSLTSKIESSVAEDGSDRFRALVAASQNKFEETPKLSDLVLRDSKSAFKGDRLLDRKTYFLESRQ